MSKNNVSYRKDSFFRRLPLRMVDARPAWIGVFPIAA
jgi:hypothetical protein